MHLLFCDNIYVVIPGQCFIYDHTKTFRVVSLYGYVAVKSVLFVFGVIQVSHQVPVSWQQLNISRSPTTGGDGSAWHGAAGWVCVARCRGVGLRGTVPRGGSAWHGLRGTVPRGGCRCGARCRGVGLRGTVPRGGSAWHVGAAGWVCVARCRGVGLRGTVPRGGSAWHDAAGWGTFCLHVAVESIMVCTVWLVSCWSVRLTSNTRKFTFIVFILQQHIC